MNMLIDVLPKTVEIDGIEYEINSDFRTSILFELLTQDNSLDDEEKILKALELYYPKSPENINEAVEKILWFYRCGKDIAKSSGKGKARNVQVYSYEHDDEYIYAAFLDQYGIDLQDAEYIHWWKFKAMFKSLKEDNEIVKIMGYRSMDLSKIKDKEQKKFYQDMQKFYEIPISKNEEQKLNDIEQALLNGEDLSKIL